MSSLDLFPGTFPTLSSPREPLPAIIGQDGSGRKSLLPSWLHRRHRVQLGTGEL